MKAASTQCTGILALVMSKGIKVPLRLTVILTFEPEGPFIIRTMLSCGVLVPAIILSPTFMIRSPWLRPAFSDGPPGMTLNTTAVSLGTLNWIPIPSKLPASAVSDSVSLTGGRYTECGSSFASAATTAASVIPALSIVST